MKHREIFYEWLWKDILHLPKPITLVLRDWFSWPLPLFLILVGMVVGHYIPAEVKWWWIVVAMFIGILFGHIFWPTKDEDEESSP